MTSFMTEVSKLGLGILSIGNTILISNKLNVFQLCVDENNYIVILHVNKLRLFDKAEPRWLLVKSAGGVIYDKRLTS